jgi:hypothetical protein
MVASWCSVSVVGGCWGGFDLARFDPVAADLQLLVGAAEELELPVGAVAGYATQRRGGRTASGFIHRRYYRPPRD